ncbi:MAG TPA: BON domain-containing protein [Vicinamibacterales bacterium]|jgi:BON domain-containing protein|nr:BON domain-containing protein [Vicinamibacterales bacterium]
MNEPLFVQVPPAWAVPQSPWMGGWYSSPGGASPPALLSPAPLGALTPPAPPTGSTPASMLVAAVSLRRGQANGPTTDQEVEEVIYDALEFVAGASDVDVRCESGRVTLSGAVPHKRLKRDVGEIAWAIPVLSDVANNVTIASRRRARAFAREAEAVPSGGGRKQA